VSTRDRNVGRVPRPRRRNNLLLWLSGADLDTLSRTPREKRKFIGVGGIVLTTSALAAASFIFALNMGARAPLYLAIPAGLLWGLAIMNLDRWLVAATQRRPKWWQNLLTALPRVLMALVIGAVISTPLVLWLFQREIDAQLNVIHQRKLDQHQQALLQDTRFTVIPDLQKRIATNQAIADGKTENVESDPTVKDLQAQYDELDRRFQAAQADATCEFDGTCGTKTRGGGPAYQQKKAVAEDLRRQRDEVGLKLDQARKDAATKQSQNAGAQRTTAADQVRRDQAELDRLQNLKKAEEDQFKADTLNDRGLLARLGALSELTGKNSTLQLAYLMLLLFITTIEVLPVAVKFLLNLAPETTYDEILREAEEADVFAAKQELQRRKDLLEFESTTRKAREQQLVQERVERMTTLGDDGYETEPLYDDERPPSRIMGWLTRRSVPRQSAGYTAWPAEEPRTQRIGSSRRPVDDDDERVSERWTFDTHDR
jgi:hypothetical protein